MNRIIVVGGVIAVALMIVGAIVRVNAYGDAAEAFTDALDNDAFEIPGSVTRTLDAGQHRFYVLLAVNHDGEPIEDTEDIRQTTDISITVSSVTDGTTASVRPDTALGINTVEADLEGAIYGATHVIEIPRDGDWAITVDSDETTFAVVGQGLFTDIATPIKSALIGVLGDALIGLGLLIVIGLLIYWLIAEDRKKKQNPPLSYASPTPPPSHQPPPHQAPSPPSTVAESRNHREPVDRPWRG